jgi:hypothetical protein
MNFLKSLPTSLFQREEKHFPLLTKGDEGGLDKVFQRAKVFQIFQESFRLLVIGAYLMFGYWSLVIKVEEVSFV